MVASRGYLDALTTAALKGEGVAALEALCRPHTQAGRNYGISRTRMRNVLWSITASLVSPVSPLER
jgi:hypothetical protein